MSRQFIHGVLVVVKETGVLIIGEAGIGKSSAALRLMIMGHKLVSDDVVAIDTIDGRLLGSCLEKTPRMEIRGVGIFEADYIVPGSVAPASPIQMVIELDEFRDTDSGKLEIKAKPYKIANEDKIGVRLPVTYLADIGFLIEFIVRFFKDKGILNGQ